LVASGLLNRSAVFTNACAVVIPVEKKRIIKKENKILIMAQK
jgi:hypothetical protein